MTTYSVQFPQMQDANDGLQNVYQSLTKIGEDLHTQVNAATANMQGDTKDLFIQAHQAYTKAHEELTLRLNRATGILAQIQEHYMLGERNGARLWS
jgi:uncharacterized protein YukE